MSIASKTCKDKSMIEIIDENNEKHSFYKSILEGYTETEKTNRRMKDMINALKMDRCAACGSTDVKVENGTYTCLACGEKLDHGMNGADLELVQRVVLGGNAEAAKELRTRYKNLDITTWTRADRLQN